VVIHGGKYPCWRRHGGISECHRDNAGVDHIDMVLFVRAGIGGDMAIVVVGER
jgi:hypothetical protein